MMPVLNTDAPAWRNFYTAAVFQDDATQLPMLIARAESEIVARARQLFEAPGDNAQEVRALHNALHMLKVLKLCVKTPEQSSKPAESVPAPIFMLRAEDHNSAIGMQS